ncbi:nucleoside-diphosphate kinase [Thermosediminibacter oceani]|uniref:Nucleoside diphosphate kinase n=1 Tax=Thermosediminibacter oceani (strain ATCC BAA-1034 / DSM 16646 / JW/IW-1228P) TaxID=555079 RepID=D9RYG2_THEOJ|nr:nucleoside-diphosphate kinase [Thermosediminibacter oceani]ADL08386.1 nucleoside diphosphate kinase [Thermosediminibacter oceani DSM 16646]
MERTFVMIKPDGVKRGLVGTILQRYEQKGLTLVAAKLLTVSRQLAEEHYREHSSKPFFRELVDYITSGPVFAMVLEGENAIKLVRLLNGATKVEEALPGTIRGDFATSTTHNLVHASDSPENARREINLWFPEL